MLPPAPLRHHFDPYAIPPPPEDYLSPMEIMMNYRPVNERELYFKKERQLDLQDPEVSAKRHKSEQKLIHSVLLLDTEIYIDTVTVDPELLADVEGLFAIMGAVSRDKAFSKGPSPVRYDHEQHKFFWENPGWFIARSYHTLAEWIVAFLEK